MPWDVDQERTFIENLLCQRFNFLLVFVSVVVAGAVSANDAVLSSTVLTVGAIVCTPLALTIARAQRRHNYMMEELVYTDPQHVATTVRDALQNTGGVPSMRNWIGYWIPLICCVGLWLGVYCGWAGFLFDRPVNGLVQDGLTIANQAQRAENASDMPGNLIDWVASDLPAWITAIAAVAAMYAIYLAARTLQFQAWLKAQELFTKDDFRRARELIFKKESPVRFEQLAQNGDDLEAADLVCRRLDELAHLFDKKVLDKRRARRCWDIAFSKALIILEPYIEERRTHDRNQALWQELVSVAARALRRTGCPWDVTKFDVTKLGETTKRVLRQVRQLPSETTAGDHPE